MTIFKISEWLLLYSLDNINHYAGNICQEHIIEEELKQQQFLIDVSVEE